MTGNMVQSRRLARTKGGWAGTPDAVTFWFLPKRVLVELVLRLAARAAGRADDLAQGIATAKQEARVLKSNRII